MDGWREGGREMMVPPLPAFLLRLLETFHLLSATRRDGGGGGGGAIGTALLRAVGLAGSPRRLGRAACCSSIA